MHDAARSWLSTILATLPPRRNVCEFGSRNVNGTVRDLLPDVSYLGIDEIDGPGVDLVADASRWESPSRFDALLCTETLEHTDSAEAICRNAYRHLLPMGVFIVTAAGIGREPHSAVDGGPLPDGEFYRNVSESELRAWLSDFQAVLIDTGSPGDIYTLAIKGNEDY